MYTCNQDGRKRYMSETIYGGMWNPESDSFVAGEISISFQPSAKRRRLCVHTCVVRYEPKGWKRCGLAQSRDKQILAFE